MGLKVVVTGANGFIGQHLCRALEVDTRVITLRRLTRQNWDVEYKDALFDADVIFHLAGVNRPATVAGYLENIELTRVLCDQLKTNRNMTALDYGKHKLPLVIFTSSTQALLPNPYGTSKGMAETVLRDYAAEGVLIADIVRLPNVFGPGARPYYNSVVATFCSRAANRLNLEVNDPEKVLQFVYVNDVVGLLTARIFEHQLKGSAAVEVPSELVRWRSVSKLAQDILNIAAISSGGDMFDVGDRFMRNLYATYLSYVPEMDYGYPLTLKEDERGHLMELMAGQGIGQTFVSETKPGIVRGGHYHKRKVEKFIVLSGTAAITLYNLDTGKRTHYPVTARLPMVVDIPLRHVHWIANVGDEPLITLFWSSEPYVEYDDDTFRDFKEQNEIQ
jgi:UDP-2-acetamido-2,6-beta-L-arabino-hexul-4-ose reductase